MTESGRVARFQSKIVTTEGTPADAAVRETWEETGVHVALERIDRSVIDAAHDLGASPFRVLRRVILPPPTPGLAAACLPAARPPSASRISLSSIVIVLGTPSIRFRPLISIVSGLSSG